MIRLAIMYWALKRSEFCKRHSTGTLTELSGKISFIWLKDWTFRKKADKWSYQGFTRTFSSALRRLTIKLSVLISVLIPPDFAEYCELSLNWKCCLVFDAWLCWTTVPTAIRRAYAVCIFLRWLFVAYLKWRSILHIFKKSLASRTAGEHCSFSWDRTGSKLSSFYFVWLVSSNYKPEFRFSVRFSRQQPDDAIRHDPVRT